MVKNTNFKFHHLNNYYYCGTCANIRPVDTTVINRNNKLYFWCQCGNQKLLTIPYFGEFQLNYIHNKIRRCKEIILNYADSFYDEIPLLIYFGSYIVPLLNQEDIIDFMFINYVYRRNLDKIKSPPDYKYQVFLRQMVEL